MDGTTSRNPSFVDRNCCNSQSGYSSLQVEVVTIRFRHTLPLPLQCIPSSNSLSIVYTLGETIALPIPKWAKGKEKDITNWSVLPCPNAKLNRPMIASIPNPRHTFQFLCVLSSAFLAIYMFHQNMACDCCIWYHCRRNEGMQIGKWCLIWMDVYHLPSIDLSAINVQFKVCIAIIPVIAIVSIWIFNGGGIENHYLPPTISCVRQEEIRFLHFHNCIHIVAYINLPVFDIRGRFRASMLQLFSSNRMGSVNILSTRWRTNSI